VVETAVAAPHGQEFTLSRLAPSQAQKRLAPGVFIILLTGLMLPIGGGSTVQLPQLEGFIPAYAAAMAAIDLLTPVEAR
jgi:hypothetical protein